MAEYAQLKAAINAVIKQNGRMEITGEVLNQVLTAMVNSLGRSMGCAGVATPATNPQSPDQNLFYFAVQAGTYVNFNSIVLPAGISVLMWNGTWTAQTWFTIKDVPEYQSTDFISAGGVFDSQKVDGNAYDISEHFPTDGVDHTNEYTLSGALAKIPENMYKAGMAIKFKESTTHNYMVFTHVGSDTTNFTSLSLWQGVANSNELFHSPNAVMRKQIATVGAVLDEFGTQNVQTLPTPSNATMNRIFVVQSKHPETDNIKTEWITIKVGNNYQWECIGGDTTGIYDLSDAMAVDGEPATYGSLADALAAVPADKKRAGMTLAFIGLYADMYELRTYERNTPLQNSIEVDEAFLYAGGKYRLSELNDMYNSMSGEPIAYPAQVGHTIFLYCYNNNTKTYVYSKITLLANQRIYEQYRFVGTDLNEFENESFWEKAKETPTSNNQLNNDRNYVTNDEIENMKPDWENMQNVTWAELVELRDNGKLVAGKFYRITDYTTTTTQEETQSAGHQFDVIVRADTASSLNENAFAVLHEGDTYFSSNGANLQAWKLMYCLDNDTSRFAWADEENGKGVIYRMIDEWGNDCPYDFKNIMFKRYKITACEYSPSLVGRYSASGINGITTDNTPIWCYTFCMLDLNDGLAHDVSVEQERYPSDEAYYFHTTNNKIGNKTEADFSGDTGILKLYLNDNIFVTDTDITAMEYDGSGYTYGEFYAYTSNVFGYNCQLNTFGNECNYNTFGNECNYNTFGETCTNNKCGDEFTGILSYYCKSNKFGDECRVILGDECSKNLFGDNCSYIQLGNYCKNNIFGDNCENINFVTPYMRCIEVENGNYNLYISCSQQTSSSNYCQYVCIGMGVNTTQTDKNIVIPTAGNTFKTTYQSVNSVVVDV